MDANKVCRVGAKKALTAFFKKQGAIDGRNRIIAHPNLYSAHSKLKTMLRDTYGIERQIINEDSSYDYIQFNGDVLAEIDAVSGVYYAGNEQYRRDFTNDRTLTPVDLVKKYVARAATPTGLEIIRFKDWSIEEVNKFKAGMRVIYPEILVKAIKTRVSNGSQLYTLELDSVPPPTVQPILSDQGTNPVTLEEQRNMEIVTAAIEPLVAKFKNARVNWISQEELIDFIKDKKPEVVSTKGMNITGVAIGKDIYLVKGMVTPQTAIEEFMHMFVDSLAEERRALYLGLLREARNNYPMLAARINIDYADENGFNQQDRDRELVAKALRDAYIIEREERPEGISIKDFLKLAKEFFKWLTQKISSALDLSLDTLPLNATISELATYLNIQDMQLPYVETTDVRFNIDPTDAKSDEFEEEDLYKEESASTKKTVKEIKIERATSQLEKLEAVATRAKGPAKQTILRFAQLTRDYISNVLETDSKTVSVSKFIGMPVFNPAFKKAAEASVNYGVFVHYYMELLMGDALAENLTVGEFVRKNPEHFNKFFEEYKSYINYNGATEEVLKEDVMKLVDIVAADSLDGILIPELTIFGKDSLGRIIDGRLDYVVVKKDGSIKIKDFKTHKSSVYMKGYTDKPLIIKRPSKRLLDGVHPFFEMIPNRTKFSDYLSQLTTYERLATQQGFKTDSGAVISMIYYRKADSFEDEGFEYGGAHVANIAIATSDGMMMGRDASGNPTTEIDSRYEKIVRVISEAIPVEGEVSSEEPVQEEVRKANEYEKLDPAIVQTALANLAAKINQQLNDIRKQISQAQQAGADETKIETLRARKALLNEANQQFKTEKDRQRYQEIPDEIILKSVIEKVFEVITTIKKESESIVKKSDAEIKRGDKVRELSLRHSQLNDYIVFLKSFDNILAANGFDSTSQARKDIGTATKSAEDGQRFYIDVAKEQMINMLLKVNRPLAERMMESMRMYFDFRKKKLEAIVAGDNDILSKGSLWLGGKINAIINSITGANTITDSMKSAAEEELKKIAFWEKNQQYDRNFVEMYVNNTFNNPQSGFYIGSTITPREASWTGDDFVASFGNSELAISAMASYGIFMTEEAKNKFFDQMEKLSIDQLYGEMTRKYGSYEAAVAAISQEVDIKDLRTGNIKKYRMFLTPEVMSYYETYDQKDFAVRSIKDQIEQIKEDSALDDTAKKAKIAELNIQLDEAQTDFMNFYLENAETEFKPEIYRLESQLPAEIQEDIDNLNTEIRQLLKPGQEKAEDFMFYDSTVTKVQELESKIAMLRRKAIEQNPNLKDVFDRLDKYYAYNVNQAGWDYQRNWIIKQWGEDSPQHKAWMDQNSELVAMPTWYKRVNDLKEEKSAIFGGGDPVLQQLFKEKKELIDKYKFKSRYSVYRVFNPLMMSEEDYQELTEIEEAIESRYNDPNKPKVRPSKEDQKRLDEINEELSNLEMRENKPSYVKDFTDKYNRLVDIKNQIIRLKLDPSKSAEVNNLMTIFSNTEIDFKNWYDRNNVSQYEIGTVMRGGSVSMDPKAYNTMNVPQDKSLMVRVPTSRWRTRTRTAEAYNPNYSPSMMKRKYGFGSYAMPKGIRYVKETGRYDVDPKSKWANPRYVEMMKDPKAMDFYNRTVMDLYINKQTNLTAQRLGHFYPSVTQPGFESIAQDGVDGLKREWKEAVDSIKLYDSMTEKDTNEFGILSNNRVRFPHNSLWTADLTTKDGLNAILKWNLSYEINQSMEEANLIMSPAIDYLKSARMQFNDEGGATELQRKQIDKVIDILEFERNKFIYGQTMTAPEGPIKSNIANRKILRMLMGAVSFGRLGLDPIMQTGNLISGNVQTFMAGEVHRNGVGGTKDLLWAKGQMYSLGGFFYKVIENWGELSGVNLQTKILRYFNPTMKDYDRTLDSTGRGKMRRLLMRAFNIKDVSFIIQDKGEMEIGITTMLKNLNAHKYNLLEVDAQGNIVRDENGNKKYKTDAQGNIMQVSAYEALIDGPGAIPAIRPDVDMTYEDLDAIKSITYNEYLKFQGNYSNYMKPKIESSIVGILMTFFRKYLVPGIENRFKGAFGIGDPKNWSAGNIQVGWWTAMMQIFQYGERGAGLQALLPGFAAKAFGMNKLNTFYASKAMQARREVMVAIALAIAFASLRALLYNDDDDEEQVGWAGLQAMRMFAKVSNESRSMLWIPGIGKSDDYVTNFSTFTSAFNEAKVLSDAVLNTFWYTTAGVFDWEYAQEMGFYQRRAGRFEKGDPKILKNFVKLTGVENVLDFFDPIFAAKEMYKRKL